MATVLSLHLGPTVAHAAVSADGRVNVLALSDEKVEVSAPDPTDGSALVRFLVDAHARCLQVVDLVPDSLVIVRPDGVGSVDPVLIEAARRARVPVPSILEEIRAVAALAAHGPIGVSQNLVPALGGIFWYRDGDAPTGPKPIVTRADLGGDAVGPDRRPPAPSVVAVGPRTVFEETGLPVRRRRGLPTPVLAILAVLVVGTLAALLLFGSDEQPIAPVPVPAPTVSEPTTPSLAVAAPTTAAASTTTSLPPATSAPTTTLPVVGDEEGLEVLVSPEGNIASDDDIAPETTEPVALTVPPTSVAPSLGRITLSGVGMTVDAASSDEALLGFGDFSDGVFEGLVGVLGEPVGDTGWGVDTECTPEEVRRLVWGGLEVVLGRDDAEGMGRLVQWHLKGQDSIETSLWTLERIGIGSTVADLRVAHGSSLLVEQLDERDPAGRFDTERVLGDGIRGAVHSVSEAGRVILMWAGEACRRWAE